MSAFLFLSSSVTSAPRHGAASAFVTARKELVCSVNRAATAPLLYPPEGLCHYLYYADLFVHKEEIVAAEIEESFEAFKTQFRTNYRRTEGGLAFDIRYTSEGDFNSKVEQQLGDLARINIKHYGILNVLARVDKMQALMDKSRGLLRAFKRIQGADKNRKTIIAIGLIDYNETNAWDRYKNWIKMAVE
ncbi:hypothetical protein V5799_023752 [Amblyomma americanum]|uniref:Uncharacterized protein n=1 Tax=Amblyomma americanum TaxID=6943 RepID=A0AAQ4FI46_AMBAM